MPPAEYTSPAAEDILALVAQTMGPDNHVSVTAQQDNVFDLLTAAGGPGVDEVRVAEMASEALKLEEIMPNIFDEAVAGPQIRTAYTSPMLDQLVNAR